MVSPPQTIISLPLQTAVCTIRPDGALAVLVLVQLSAAGLYLPPVSKGEGEIVSRPPQTIISLPVHTTVLAYRPEGTLLLLVGSQVSAAGLYFPPVFEPLQQSTPPHTIISLPVQTAVGRNRPEGALVVLVAVQLSVPGLYLPPVLK